MVDCGRLGAWGAALRVVALPLAGGVLNGRTLGWGQLALKTDGGSEAPPQPWVLYGAVGSELVVADIQAARNAVDTNSERLSSRSRTCTRS